MLYKVCFITNSELDTGFRLGGGEVFSVRSKDQLFDTFRRLIADEKVGLIGIQEDFFSEIKRSFAKELKEGWPLVISFPSEIFEGKKRDHVAELIKEAIGYYVKLR